MATPSSDGPVDEEILSELLMVMDDGSMDGLITICDLFLTGVPDRLSDIEAALAEGRLDDVAAASHSLKGTGGAFGARRLGEMAGQLEQACRQNDLHSATALLERVKAEYIVFRNILEVRLAASSAPS